MWGRFVNADTVLGKRGKLLDHNLFSYCGQNPVMRSDPGGMYDPDERAYQEEQRKAAEKKKKGGVTVTAGKKTVTIYGPYAAAIAKMVESPQKTYADIDCQQAVRFVLPGNSLKQGSGGMWKNNVQPIAAAQADCLAFSDCTDHKPGVKANCTKYPDDHKGHVGLVTEVDWHDGNGIVLSVYQSCAGEVTKTKALWENDELGGPNLTGFSDKMIYFGVIKPEFLGN